MKASALSGEDGLIKKLRPDLLELPTTNGDHCTGDGMKMGMAIGAATGALDCFCVHDAADFVYFALRS